MKPTHLLTVTLLLMGGLFHPLGAQWVLTNAPEGVYVYAFAVSGTNVFAGIDTDALVDFGGSVLRSTDNGANWTDISNGLVAPEVRALAISGTNIFAGTWGGGVFLSTDNGANWTAVNSGLAESTVTSLAVNGSDIFAGTYGGGVFMSTDTGANWTAVSTGLTNLNIWSLAVSDTNIFAGTDGGGVFLSTDYGMNWIAVNNGLPSPLYGVRLAISGTNIFAGNGGVHRSIDNGANWTDVSEGLPNRWVFDLTVLDTNIFALTNWGGVSVSTDNGANWTLVNEGLIDTLTLAIGVSDTYAFVGGESGSMWRRPLSEMITQSVISVEDVSGFLPSSFNLNQNYPNPFNPSTTLRFALPQAATVRLVVYDLQGREVARLLDGDWPAGYHHVVWDGRFANGRAAASGIYIARLVTPEVTRSIKMVLLR